MLLDFIPLTGVVIYTIDGYGASSDHNVLSRIDIVTLLSHTGFRNKTDSSHIMFSVASHASAVQTRLTRAPKPVQNQRLITKVEPKRFAELSAKLGWPPIRLARMA
jgi:hypothetical protein